MGASTAIAWKAFTEIAELLRDQKGGEWALFGPTFLAERIEEMAKKS
jgi:hypothetical protein